MAKPCPKMEYLTVQTREFDIHANQNKYVPFFSPVIEKMEKDVFIIANIFSIFVYGS